MKKVKNLSAILIIAAIMIIAAKPSFAQAETHDGFFLRFQTGIGYGHMTEKDVMGSDLEIYGASYDFYFQLGGALVNNFILHLNLGGSVLMEPEVKWGSETATATDAELTVYNYGAGISYYIMPGNMYISINGSAMRSKAEGEYGSGYTDWGFGITGVIGKEWWVSENWGLGIAFIAYYGRTKAEEPDMRKYDIDMLNFSIAFSATFN
ncbi:hypothetical protein ACFL20_07180 [Spirochaetota bacterium]